MYVADGLGGLPQQPGGLTELETANTPNLDALAKAGVLGSSIPVCPGISPGSGPGHLGLFGYDPLQYVIGRGALEATGIGFELKDGDVAIRANFCTLDAKGQHHRSPRRPNSDRRKCTARDPASQRKDSGYRSLRRAGEGTSIRHRPPRPRIARQRARHRSASHGGATARPGRSESPTAKRPPKSPRNSCGKLASCCRPSQSQRPHAPRLLRQTETTELRRSLRPERRRDCRVPDVQRPRPSRRHGHRRQGTNACRADDRARSRIGRATTSSSSTTNTPTARAKTATLPKRSSGSEDFDAAVPRITALKPDVLIVTGDHSTPSMLASHSWHPVPTLLSAKFCRTDGCEKFGESDCLRGGLGQFEAKYLMTLALANSRRLNKYGA